MVETRPSGYASIPGSAALGLRSGGEEPKLRRVVVHRDFLPVPLDVFDRLALGLEPEELTVYLQLFRLSVGEEKNGCRVSRAELERRVRVSQLRLGKALAGLVEKRHVELLDRSREGTLYRVLLPEELLDGAETMRAADNPPRRRAGARQAAERRANEAVKRAPSAASSPAAAAPAPSRARPQRLKRDRPARTRGDEAPPAQSSAAASVGELARWFLQVGGAGRGRSPDEVLQEILGLVEEGLDFEEIRATLERFLAEAPKKTPIAEVARWRR